jgi:hypothetical protein
MGEAGEYHGNLHHLLDKASFHSNNIFSILFERKYYRGFKESILKFVLKKKKNYQ